MREVSKQFIFLQTWLLNTIFSLLPLPLNFLHLLKNCQLFTSLWSLNVLEAAKVVHTFVVTPGGLVVVNFCVRNMPKLYFLFLFHGWRCHYSLELSNINLLACSICRRLRDESGHIMEHTEVTVLTYLISFLF